MRIISTKIHGVLDYIMGLLLMAAPWTFGFAGVGAATWIPAILGISTIVYSLLTSYELGITGKIPMKLHLLLELLSGILLAVSPWLFRFSEFVIIPHVVLGSTVIAAVLLSKREPEHTPGSPFLNTPRNIFQAV